MFTALLAALGIAGSDTTSKKLLDDKEYPIKRYLPLLFLLLAVITAIFVPFSFHFDAGKAFSFKYLIIFAAMIFAAVSWNIRYYTSIKKETLHEFELVLLLTPITTVILASIFYKDERDTGLFIAALIASGALIFSRIQKQHIILTQNIKRTLLAMFFMAVEVLLLKTLLDAYSPTFLYLIRTIILCMIYVIIYKPRLTDYRPDIPLVPLIIVNSAFGVLQMVMKYYSYHALGIVETTTILLIAPIIVYAVSYFYFLERRNFKKDAIAATIIIGCILYTIFR